MKIFLLDLWHDLREKRLAPVAVVLLLGLVAVPVLLAKPAEEPAAPPVPANAAASKPDREALAALAKVKLGEEQVGKGSTLGVFDPDNPFAPPKGTIKKDEPIGSGDGPGSSPSTSGGAPSGGTSGGSTGGSPGVTPGGGTTGGGTPGVPPGGGTPGGDQPQTTVYKYVVDITFTANDRTRRIKGLEKLDMLPNEAAPLLIFMGVTAKGNDAVFLVDSTLQAAGEGRCTPSADKCAFAYIGAGAEYIFTEEDGDSYTVRVDEIRKVKVSPSGSASKAKGAKGAKAHAAVGPERRFVPPVLVDEIVVSSDRLENSNSDPESR